MKLNKIKSLIVLSCMTFFVSCNDEFLEVEPKGTDLEDNYYSNQAEAFAGLTAIYDVLGWNNYSAKLTAVNAASDDHLSGGGSSTDISEIQVWSNYTLNQTTGPQWEFWKKGYSGIFRANVLIQKLPAVPMSQSLINTYTAESKALRAYFYFDLVRFFKNIPLITAPVSTSQYYNIPQALPQDVFTQIENDLLQAIPDLPPTVVIETDGGRFTQAAARALLGKVYLWQDKFALAAEQLAYVNGTPGGTSQYGNKLLANYSDLWLVDNKFNSESILEISHTNSGNFGDWGNLPGSEGNIVRQMVGPRNYNRISPSAPDYNSGWGFNPITEDLFNAFNGDPRKSATIINLKQMKLDGIADYEPGYLDTGYFIEKFAGRVSDRHTGGGAAELNWRQNTYEIRLADTYLMEAEALVRGGGDATRAKDLLDAVRARVGLTSIPATFDNIFKERRLELAGEGHRWFDLIRTGKAATALASRGFIAGKHEVLPIPFSELDNTLLIQNPNYIN